MAPSSLAHPAHPESTVPDETRERVARGLNLFRTHRDRIHNLGRGYYSVPSCSGDGSYTVHLAVLGGEESCECRDFRRRGELCKHVYAACLFRAKVQRRRWLAKKAERRRAAVDPDVLAANLDRMGA